ncbi:hypothetical protein [Comamonas sp. JC664]|uniref:hypothetical protein n=1 Tax=Comamonas sp. JC664 TaxID=2801917 RepID=UPI00174AC5D9|nr:hypothetical protein [Comamonas sp. JC664]MBL0696568.1 hypothetical protein [Comamonas sp. JC664]GHG84862.1 hypothetical protein GCM10012319_40970 [Comamonas sp. KCTC 72670]
MTKPEWLELAARRSKDEPWMLGHAFAKYRQLEGMSEEELAKELGCSVETLNWMSLCRRPESDHFKEQATAIAEEHGVNDRILRRVLGRLKIVEVFQDSSNDGSANQGGVLMAAQDREPDEEPQT